MGPALLFNNGRKYIAEPGMNTIQPGGEEEKKKKSTVKKYFLNGTKTKVRRKKEGQNTEAWPINLFVSVCLC